MSLLLALLLLAPQENEVRQLIEKIRSGTLDEREAATRRLKEMGKTAVAELEKSVNDPDAEVASRVHNLLARLQLLESLTPELQKAIPRIVDSLAQAGDGEWTRAFLEAETLRRKGSRLPLLKSRDLEPLAERALRGAATREAKREVVEAIQGRRLSSASTELLKLLDDVFLRESAFEAIQQHPSDQAIQRLRDLTRDDNPETRAFAVESLHELDARDGAPDAAKLLEDRNPEVRAAAAAAVAHLRGRAASGDLVRLLKDKNEDVRRAAVSGLLAIYAKAEAPKIAEALRDPDRQVRTTAAKALGLLGYKEAVPALIGLLKDEVEVRSAALVALRMLRAKEAIPEGLKHLEDAEGWRAIYDLQDLMIELDPREARERAVTLLNHSKSDMRRFALQMLGSLGDASVAPEILKMLREGKGEDRIEAAFAAGRLHIREAIPDIAKLVEEPDQMERSEPIWALAVLGAKESIPKLLECLKAPALRNRTVEALGILRAKEAVPALVEILKGTLEAERIPAVAALVRIEGRDALPQLLTLLEDKDSEVCVEAIDQLSNLEAWDQAPKVAPFLDDREGEARYAAARFMARAGSREGVAILLEEEEGAFAWLLNALRSPDAWKRLQETKVVSKRRGRTLERVRALAKEAGFEVVVEDSTLEDAERWLEREGPARAYEDPRPAGDEIWFELPMEYEMILEAGRLRLVPRESALRFWREWWKEGGPAVK